MRRRLNFGWLLVLALLTCGCPKPPPSVHVVAMHWDPVAVKDYRVYRGVSPDDLMPLEATTDTRYVDRKVIGGTTYYYIVKGRDAAGTESVPSNEVSFTVPNGN